MPTKIDFQLDFGSGFTSALAPPRNWKAMQVQLVFDKPNQQAQLQSILFEWVNENATKIKSYVAQGLAGGTGIFEGPGFRAFVGNGHQLIFDGCLNTADPSFLSERGIVKAPIKESGRIDWLNDVAKSITFEYLTDDRHAGQPWHITRSDYKQVPYCISTIPDYTQAAMLSITLFIMIKETVDVIAKIESFIARMTGQGFSWIQLIMTIIEVILYIIYLIIIVQASLQIIQDLIDNIIQAKKTKLGMREVDLWVKAAAYFRLTFSSTIYGMNAADGYGGRYANATLIPKKIVVPDGDPIFHPKKRPEDETTSPDAYGYYEGTFKKFINDMCQLYNGEAVICGNTLYFNEKHHWNLANPYRMPNEGEVGFTFNYPDPHGTNANEIKAVTIVQFQKDEQDLNTYNDYNGTYAIAQTIPNVVRNPKNQMLAGSENIQIPFALARRKLFLSRLEKSLLGVISQFNQYANALRTNFDAIENWISTNTPGGTSDALDQIPLASLVGLFTGAGPATIGSILFSSDGFGIMPVIATQDFDQNRIGWMLLSNDYIGVPKRFIGEQNGDDWFISDNNEAVSYSITNTTPITDPTSINGFFIGILLPQGIPVTGNVINGFIPNAHGSTPMPSGPVSGQLVGTISGMPGNYVASSVFGSIGASSVNVHGPFTDQTLSSITNTGGYGSALSLMSDFWMMNTIDNNQWLTFKNKKIRFGIQDFLQVNNNNVFITADGRYGKFEKILWDLHNDTATVDYRIKEKYTNNYTTKVTTDGG